MDVLVQLAIYTLITGSIYALVASGLVFIYSTTRIFHLAHGGVIAIAAYVFWFGSQELGLALAVSAGLAVLTAMALGALMNEGIYETLRARRTKGLGYLIASITLLMMCGAVILLVFGSEGETLGFQSPMVEIFGARISGLQIGLVSVTAAIFVCLIALLRFTRFGKAMRATADNEIVAEVLGIDTRRVRRRTFLLGSALGGVAGVLYALEFNLDPAMGVMLAIKGFAAAVIGGPGSMVGAVLGALLLSGAEQASVWYLGSTWRNAVAFVLLFVFLLVKPTGFLGRGRYS